MSFALVVCNGEPPDPKHLNMRAQSASVVVAADGGLDPLLKAGITPDILIGDLDSCDAPYPNGVNVVIDLDQETNDLEKALNHLMVLGQQNVVVLGATGLRLDHTLKNLSVLQQFHQAFKHIVFEDNHSSMRIADKHTVLSLRQGTAISLFPMSGKVEGIVTQGLMYQLTNESLENGVRDGSSNRVVSSPVSIRYERGCLLLIINHTSIPEVWH